MIILGQPGLGKTLLVNEISQILEKNIDKFCSKLFKFNKNVRFSVPPSNITNKIE